MSNLQYLLDTDTCIYLLNGDPTVVGRAGAVGVDALAVAIPTIAELCFGAYNSGRIAANVARIRAFMAPPGPAVLEFDEPAAEQFGRLKADLRRVGRAPTDIDLMLASVAVVHGLVVVTNNTRHFAPIASLTVENWRAGPVTP